jgi:methylenetetrahydrofolate reductase (NADPH)
MIKSALFNCQECGDCSLPDITYLCPESQCSKNQRNGPCGGSDRDKCEVTKYGKYCIWVKAYNRNKYFNKGKVKLLDRPAVLKDNNLYRTSGWANYFLQKDHSANK